MNYEQACRALLAATVPLVRLDAKACQGCGKPMGPGDEYDRSGACEACVMRSFAEHG